MSRVPPWAVGLSFGGAVFAALRASAQEVGSQPDPVAGIAADGAVGALLTSALVLVLRRPLAALNLSPARRKLATQALALASGLAVSLAGLGPNLAPGLPGRLLSGVLLAALATYGRDAVVRGAGRR